MFCIRIDFLTVEIPATAEGFLQSRPMAKHMYPQPVSLPSRVL